MTDWVDILLKEKFSDESSPSENIRWERFEALRRGRRKKKIAWISCLGGAIAATIAPVFVSSTDNPIDNDVIPLNTTAYIPNTQIDYHGVESIKETVMSSLSNKYTPRGSVIEKVSSSLDSTVVFNPIIVETNKPVRNTDNSGENEQQYNYEISPDSNGDPMGKTTGLGVKISPFIRSSQSKNTYNDSFRFNASFFDQVSKYFPFTYGNNDNEIAHTIFSHSIPFSFGVEISYLINPRIEATSGVELSVYRSHFTSPRNSIDQSAYYLGIPLRLDWVAWQNGPVSAWVGAGGKVDRLVYGKFGPARIHDKRFNWSLTGDAGIQYELFPKVGLFFSPEISYYFKPSNPVIQTYRTENPLMITLGAGLRVSL